MRYLFVHQNFPGQFLHLLRHLVAQGGNDIVFISEPSPNNIPGVRLLTHPQEIVNDTVFPDAKEFDLATRRARVVQEVGMRLKGLGFTPDIVIGHHGWGELLNMNDVWPGVPVLGYSEFFYRESGFDVGFDPEFPAPADSAAGVRAKNAVNLIALNNPGHGQTPTRFQLSTYPDWAKDRITVLPEGVDLQTCRPDPAIRTAPLEVGGMVVAPTDTLVTYVARDLEPYRGFHVMMRAIPAIQRLRPDLKVVLIGGDGVSYGARIADRTWREHMMSQVGDQIDPARICFPGRIDYGPFIRVLQRSDAHCYLTYPFVLSWSLREALACGCAIVASDTAPVQEFVTNGRTGLLVPFSDHAALAASVARILSDRTLSNRLRRNARRFAEANLRMDTYLAAYQALIADVIANGSPRGGSPAL